MSKTYKLRGAVAKVRNPVVLAMIREAKRSVAHGRTYKAERREAHVQLRRMALEE